MRIQFSEKVNKLVEEVLPYVHPINGLNPNAPEDVKKKYIEVRKLIEDECSSSI